MSVSVFLSWDPQVYFYYPAQALTLHVGACECTSVKLLNVIVHGLSLAELDCSSGRLAFLKRAEVKYLKYLIHDSECFQLDEAEFPFLFQTDTSQGFESQEYIFER